MDDRRFDDLTRLLSTTGQSRRTAIRTLTGGALAGVLTRLGGEETDAKRRGRRRRRRRRQCDKIKKIGQKCKRRNGAKCACEGGGECRRSVCRCPRGQEESGGVCGTRPNCTATADFCNFGVTCCSGDCHELDFCLPSAEGEQCLTSADCAQGLRCEGFRCV